MDSAARTNLDSSSHLEQPIALSIELTGPAQAVYRAAASIPNSQRVAYMSD
jgi:hypothetical protein